MSDAQNGIVSGLDGKIARTRDGGATWKFQPMQLDRPIIDPLFTPFLFADGTGWAHRCGGRGGATGDRGRRRGSGRSSEWKS